MNPAGFDYYDRLVDELLANGVDPYVTLYHWDLPQGIEDRGGWPARDTVDAFADYTEVVVSRLGDVRTPGSVGTEPVAEPRDHPRLVLRDPVAHEVYLLARLHCEYELPDLYITENGAVYAHDRRNGSVSDPQRISYLEGHLAALGDSIAGGVPVRGYFLWSLLDNFEWAFGYTKRFGIVYVDLDTLERVPKASYHWSRDLIAASRASA